MNNIYQKEAKIQHINILLIEDNPGDAKLVEIYLKDATSINFKLKHAVRLSEGMQIAQQNPEFDIVLLDLSLRIPVVVLTTSNADNDVKDMYDLHANCYITKPVDFDQFMDVIQAIEQFWLTIVRLPSKY